MPSELRWGIIGCGDISHDFVLAMRNCKFPNVIRAVATANDLNRAREFASSLKLSDADVTAYGSYEEMLRDENVDCVYVGILNSAHCEWVCNALNFKKHVLCEKPLCGTVAEAQRMIDCAKSNGRFLMEAWWPRCFPAYRALKDTIESGEMGAVRFISANFGSANLPKSRFEPGLVECPLNDIGSYLLQFALFCVKDARPDKAEICATKNGEGNVDIGGCVYMEWNGGKTRANLVYTTECNTVHSGFVAFDNGLCEFPESFNCPTRLTKIGEIPKGGLPPRQTQHWPLNDNADEYNFQNSSGLHYEADHVYECVQAGRTESPFMPWSTSITLTELTDNLRQQIGISYPTDGGECKKKCTGISTNKQCQGQVKC